MMEKKTRGLGPLIGVKICKKFKRLERKWKKLSEGIGAGVSAHETAENEIERNSGAHTRGETGTVSYWIFFTF